MGRKPTPYFCNTPPPLHKQLDQSNEKLAVYEECRKAKDVIKLLRLIQAATNDSDGNKNPTVTLVESDMDLFTSHQMAD